MSEATGTEIMQGGAVPAETTEHTTESLVRFAIEQKVPVEVLERLVALQERVSDRQARSAFFASLAAFQEACGDVPTNREAKLRTTSGSTFRFRYASLDGIARHVRGPLQDHGFSYSWDTAVNENMVTVTATLRHVDGHEQSATFTAPVESYGAKLTAAQDTAKVVTYGKRQALLQVLGVAVEGEDDEQALARSAKSQQSVNAGQVADLEVLIEEVGADRGKFLQWLDVTSLEELTMTQYHNAVQALERKREAS